MPIHHNANEPAAGIDLEITLSGALTPCEILDYVRDILKFQSSWNGKCILLNFTDSARASGFNYAALSALASATRSFESRMTGVSIVAVSPRALFYGLLRMYLAIRDPPHSFHVFRSRNAAIDWVTTTVGERTP